MSSKLSIDEVKHVAELARIRISDSEVEKYREQLGQLMDSVKKIEDVSGYDDEFIISPFSHDAILRDDEVGSMLEPVDVLKNVPRKNGNYVEVPVVINE